MSDQAPDDQSDEDYNSELSIDQQVKALEVAALGVGFATVAIAMAFYLKDALSSSKILFIFCTLVYCMFPVYLSMKSFAAYLRLSGLRYALSRSKLEVFFLTTSIIATLTLILFVSAS